MGNKIGIFILFLIKELIQGLFKFQTTNPTRDNQRVQKYDLVSFVRNNPSEKEHRLDV
jgi:hypothetical protein